MDDDDHRHPEFPLSPLVVGLIGILCGAVIVFTFHCIALGWCSPRRPPPNPPNRPSQIVRPNQAQQSTTGNSSGQLITIYKYTNNEANKEGTCAVCLGEFTEGEEVRVLHECGHSFHVPCIDMWLWSHPNCPLCRAVAIPASLPPPPHLVVALSGSGGVPPLDMYRLPDFGG
ncbi:RING-H2 finger protein [Actinidia chinensis var. chinensis]|uniref:RING-H2 finger protein n=1 Tax=Actinidia chinensis var. chinensis TaxID=1590841 RepID=A0A2R6PWX9_ACTCC|nr:RING-H2 finger protein [Actinidia chinensis var. chinensis]